MIQSTPAPASGYTTVSWPTRLGRLGIYLVLVTGAVAMIAPFVWSVTTSLKPAAELFAHGPFWVPWPPDFSAYRALFAEINFGLYTVNTVKVATLITIAQLFTASLAGYAFARIPFPGRNTLFLIFLMTMMVPAAVTMVPNFFIMRNLRLVDTHAGLVLPVVATAYGTFLLRQFYLSFPNELEEAAKLDGCTPPIFWARILLPNSTAVLSALGLLTFQWAWNDFLWPLVMINSPEKRTLQLGLSALLNENYINWPWLMAASVLTTLPMLLLFVAAQRQFVQSVRLSGVKG